MTVMMPVEDLIEQRLDGLAKEVREGFAHLDKRIDEQVARVDEKIDEGLARTDKKMDEGFARSDKKIDLGLAQVEKTMSEGFQRVDNNFVRVDADIRELRRDLTFLQRTLLAASVATFLTFIGVTIQLLVAFAG